MKKKQSKIGYRVSQHLPHTSDNRSEYGALVVEVFPDWSDRWNPGSFCIKWQSNSASPLSFYGGCLDMSRVDTLEQMHLFTKTATKLFKAPENRTTFAFRDSAEAVLAALIESGTQIVYDGRESANVRIEDVKPESWRRYYDDAKRYRTDESGCTVSTMAPDENEARRLLTIDFAGEVNRKDRFDKWLAAGRPIRTSSYDHPPTITPAAPLLATLRADREEREKKQADEWAAAQAQRALERAQAETAPVEAVAS